MDENKQIAEIAKDIYDTGVAIDGVDLAFGLFDNDDHFHRIAKELYSKGYRKQSDTVREFVSKIDGEIQHTTIVNDYTPDFDEMQDIIYQTAKEYGVEVEE